MESLLPQLFFLSFLAPIIIRLAIAAVLFYDARDLWGHGDKYRAQAIGLLISGILIGVGFLTQIVVIIAGIGIIYLATSQIPSVFKNRLLALLALSILLSLLVTGPGGIAFDLPY